MSKNSNKFKLAAFFGFLILLFSGAFFMYTQFVKKAPKVNPKEVPYRTKQSPFYVDSLKKAGYYDSLTN